MRSYQRPALTGMEAAGGRAAAWASITWGSGVAIVVPICGPELSSSAWFHVEAGKSATWPAVLTILSDLQRGPWPLASSCGPPR